LFCSPQTTLLDFVCEFGGEGGFGKKNKGVSRKNIGHWEKGFV